MTENDLVSSMLGSLQRVTKPSRHLSASAGTMFLDFPPELKGTLIRRQVTFTEPWGDRFSSGVAVFPRSNRIIVNENGVFIPQNVLGNDVVVESERELLHGGGVRVIVSAQPRNRQVEPPRRVEVIDCSRELQWVKEHRHEYTDQWVALDGDRLLAYGPNALEVYDEARNLGVPVPSVLRVEASDELAVSRQQADATESLEREFKSLAARWRNETTHLSISSEKANNFAYQQIIGMGEQVLPLIFRELETTTSDWFWALRAIARDRAPVIRAEDRGRVRRIAEIWMEWGKQNGYVSG
jgi:hypothetical protein